MHMEQPRDLGTNHGYQAGPQDSQRNGQQTCCAGIPRSLCEWNADGLWVCVLLMIVCVDVLMVFVVLMVVVVAAITTW